MKKELRYLKVQYTNYDIKHNLVYCSAFDCKKESKYIHEKDKGYPFCKRHLREYFNAGLKDCESCGNTYRFSELIQMNTYGICVRCKIDKGEVIEKG